MIKKNTDEQISRFELDSNTHSRHHDHDKLAPPDGAARARRHENKDDAALPHLVF